jgi:hypothetical protein
MNAQNSTYSFHCYEQKSSALRMEAFHKIPCVRTLILVSADSPKKKLGGRSRTKCMEVMSQAQTD